MSEENDTSSATDQPVKDVGITAGERMFPVQHHPTLRYVPWRIVEPGRDQAMENHHQTLERLAQRGGLDPGEIWCAVEGRGIFDQAWTKLLSEWCDKWLVLRAQAPAEVSDKRQDWKVADEYPQLSREQIDDMNSGD